MLHRALDLAKRRGCDEQAGRAYANLYSIYSRRMKIAEGEGVLVEGIAYCDEHDISTFGNCLRGERTVVLNKLGRYDEAETLAQQLLARTGPSPVNRLNPLVSLGRVRARRGGADVWECLDEANTLAAGLGRAGVDGARPHCPSRGCWLEGTDRGCPETSCDGRQTPAHRLTAASSGGPLPCGSERDPWRRWTGRAGLRRAVCRANSPGARAAAAGGTARSALRRSSGTARQRRRGDLRAALATFEELVPLRPPRIARQQLRQRGVRSVSSGVRASTKAHPAGLTRREHEVLELVCEGLSNEEISGVCSSRSRPWSTTCQRSWRSSASPRAEPRPRGRAPRLARGRKIGAQALQSGWSAPDLHPLLIRRGCRHLQHSEGARQCRCTWMSTHSTEPSPSTT